MYHKVLDSFGRNVGEETQMNISLVGMHDSEISSPRPLLCRCQSSQSLLLSRRSFIIDISVKALAIGITVETISAGLVGSLNILLTYLSGSDCPKR